MKIWFDDIVYFLQKAGGISVMWSHITNGVPCECNHIRFGDTTSNPLSAEIEGHNYVDEINKFFILHRYINPRLQDEKEPFLFNSSYYRYCKNRNAINIVCLYDFIYEYYDNRLVANLHKWQKRNTIMHSDGVICISESTKKDLHKFYPDYKGLVCVAHCGYDSNVYYYKEEFRRERTILTIGGRKGYKRFDLTVQIVKALPDCKLVMVGGGQLTNEEKDLLEKNIPGRYEKAGYLSNDDLRHLYNRSFFLSYPSDYEGFGIPPIEAQACGCPVVCQARSSLPEVVQDTAIFIDPSDMKGSMKRVKELYDESYYNEIVQKGLENVKRFSWDKCRDETVAFYKEVLKSKGIED